MKKNDVYIEILQMTLPHLRMVASSGLFYRMRDKSSLYET